jgi:hypothetical protein
MFSMSMRRRRNAARSTAAILLLSTGLGLFSAAARAGDDAPAGDNVVKRAFKVFGFATDPGPPEDFVVRSRPTTEQDYVPVGRPAFQRSIKPKTPDELKAMQTEFDAVKANHDAIRASFPPAAQAMAAAEAAKAAKAKKPKKPAPAPAPAQ